MLARARQGGAPLPQRIAKAEVGPPPAFVQLLFDAYEERALWLGLAIAGTAWVLVSAVLVALFVTSPITGWEAFIRHVILSQGSNLFPVWMALGALGASLVFAATVVSAPLLLDRDTDLWTAVSTSVRVVAENPLAMGFWATLIMLATALSMATAMLGFVISIPVIGHATWHAYRETVDARELPARE